MIANWKRYLQIYRARFIRIAELIAFHGLPNVREPYVKHIQGELWEIRIKGKSGISRAIYVTVKPKRVVVLRVFIKKSNKTPRKEIDLASRRAMEIK